MAPGILEGPGSSTGSSGVELDPLTGTEDSGKPLLSKLMAVPSLRARYLGYVRAIAEEWLNWGKLGELAQGYHALIRDDVRTDTHKLDSFAGGSARSPPVSESGLCNECSSFGMRLA